MCSVQLGRTRHIRKKLHFTDECHQMMVLIRKRAHFTDNPPPSLSRHRVFSRKGCVAARGTSQFRRVCSRYRVFDRKRCVAEGKAAQGAKICSRYRVFSSKGCVAARGTSQFRKFCSRYRVFDRKRCVAGRARRVRRIGRENIREEEKVKRK